jgi:hypothetical protein
MLVVCGCHERTADEYSELFGKSGFEPQEIVLTKSPVSILIGQPC